MICPYISFPINDKASVCTILRVRLVRSVFIYIRRISQINLLIFVPFFKHSCSSLKMQPFNRISASSTPPLSTPVKNLVYDNAAVGHQLGVDRNDMLAPGIKKKVFFFFLELLFD